MTFQPNRVARIATVVFPAVDCIMEDLHVANVILRRHQVGFFGLDVVLHIVAKTFIPLDRVRLRQSLFNKDSNSDLVGREFHVVTPKVKR